MKARRRGFTIVELMIVIVIIGILIAIIVPTVTSAIDSANKASDQSDMKNMNTQLQMYKIMEDVSSVDYHAAVLWLTSNGYSLQSKASNQSFWFNSRTETIEYGTIEEMISSSSLTGGTVLASDLNTDPGRISNNPDLTLIDQRADNDMIVAVNGIRNLVNNAIAEVGNTYDDVTKKMQKLFKGYLDKVDNGEVKTKLMAFDPDKTMYISESGVYYNGTGTTIKQVMFAQSIRYISASSSAAGTKYDLNRATIQLPKSLLLVMPEALSRLSNVIFEGKNTQFITGSLDSAVAAESGLVMVTPSEISSREELKYEVIYTQKEAVYKDGEIEKTVKIALNESNMALNGNIADYGLSPEGKTMLREYLVPSLKIINNGLFANVSGVEVIMSRSSNIIVCYAIAYGSNGTIIGTVVMGYCTDIAAGSAVKTNDPQNSTKDYLYYVSDPFQGYDFSSVFREYGEYTVKAYSGNTPYTLTDDGTSDFLYEPKEGEGFPDKPAERFELLYGDRVFFVKYIQKD